MGGLMDYKARFYSSYLNHFIQPDTLIPDPPNSQDWNRYSYVYNRPINLNDPTGHCPFCIAAVVGGLIGAGVNLYTQYQDGGGSFENVNWGEVAVGGAVGAVAGLVGAALIVPGATAIAAATGTGLVGEIVAGSFMAGTANVILSNTQRVATNLIKGNEVNAESINKDFADNYVRDMAYGALGYNIGKAISPLFNKYFMVLDDWRVTANDFKGQPFLNPVSSQQVVVGIVNASVEAISNSTLLDCTVGGSCNKKQSKGQGRKPTAPRINNILMR
jgi:RHS repeat-associated protein